MAQAVHRFEFNANASEVYGFMLGPATQPRALDLSADELSGTCWLLPGTDVAALYSISLDMALYSTEANDAFGEHEAGQAAKTGEPVMQCKVGHIVLAQERAGQCLASLYISPDWRGELSRVEGVQRETLERAVIQLAVTVWRTVIEAWLVEHVAASELDQQFSNDEVAALRALAQKHISADGDHGRQGRPGGRRAYADDDWAYEQVEVLGREPYEVYQEWRRRISPERREALADPYNAFQQAIYRRRRRNA